MEITWALPPGAKGKYLNVFRRPKARGWLLSYPSNVFRLKASSGKLICTLG